jgi:iron complex transport system permease protein
MLMKNTPRPYLISLLLVCVVIVVSIGVGSVFISPKEIFLILKSSLLHTELPKEIQPLATILLKLRLPRTALILMTGAALSGSGAAYQGLFKNPLADPYLIGISSGAGLGAVIAIGINWPYSTLGLFAVPITAFAGAITTVLIVYTLAKVGKTVPTTNLILAGVAVSAFASAITSFLMLISTNDLHRALSWLMGGSTMSGWKPVFAALPYILVGLGSLLTMGHKLNVLQFGDEQAQQMGLQVEKSRRIIIVFASLTTAAAVAFAGVIGFVGLIIPHIIRLVWTNDYRHLLPLSMICGGSLLLVADILARVLLAPQEIPVGIITSLAGAPFFVWILQRAKKQNFW